MADNLLSREEMESLLASADERQRSGASGPPLSPPHWRSRDKEAPYDRAPAALLSPARWQQFSDFGDAFAQGLSASLGELLRREVVVRFEEVVPSPHSQFVLGLENPTCLMLISAPPLARPLLIDLPLAILYPMIERLLGGGLAPTPAPRRPLSEIESRVTRWVTDCLTRQLRESWLPLGEIAPALDQQIANPLSTRLLPGEEPLAHFTWQVQIGPVRGPLRLAVPLAALAVDAQPAAETCHGTPDPLATQADLVVELAESKISAADLAQLAVGDLIMTEQSVHAPLVLRIDGQARYLVKPGTLGDRKAVEIERSLDDDPTVD